MKEIILENTNHPHIAKSGELEVIQNITSLNTITFKSTEEIEIFHGEHNNIMLPQNSTMFYKVTQQEFNPVTKALQNAFD